jgi:hypothetical protein
MMCFLCTSSIFYLTLNNCILGHVYRSADSQVESVTRMRGYSSKTQFLKITNNVSIFKSAVFLFRRLQLITEVMNSTMKYIFLATVGIVSIFLGALFLFMSVSCFGRIPWSTYFIFPIGEFLIVLMSIVVLPEFAKVHETSNEYLRMVKYMSVGKIHRRIVRSILPLRLYVGPFLYFTRSTQASIIYEMLNYGTTLLLSVSLW